MYYFERVENTRGRNLKMCLFPLFSLFLYIYIYFNFKEVGNISPIVLFPWRGKKFNDLYHFQKVKNTSLTNFKLCKLFKTVYISEKWQKQLYFLCLFTYLISFPLSGKTVVIFFMSLSICFHFHKFENISQH